MIRIARAYLYINVLLFAVIGSAGLFAPLELMSRLHLAPVSISGISEVRGLYGGGFIGIALALLGGLRISRLSQGLLIAIGTVMAGIVAGRVLSLILDHDYVFAAGSAIAELLVVAACYAVSNYARVQDPFMN